MRLTEEVGSQPGISFTTRTSRVGSEVVIGAAGVATNLVHHPGELDGVHGAAAISYAQPRSGCTNATSCPGRTKPNRQRTSKRNACGTPSRFADVRRSSPSVRFAMLSYGLQPLCGSLRILRQPVGGTKTVERRQTSSAVDDYRSDLRCAILGGLALG